MSQTDPAQPALYRAALDRAWETPVDTKAFRTAVEEVEAMALQAPPQAASALHQAFCFWLCDLSVTGRGEQASQHLPDQWWIERLAALRADPAASRAIVAALTEPAPRVCDYCGGTDHTDEEHEE